MVLRSTSSTQTTLHSTARSICTILRCYWYQVDRSSYCTSVLAQTRFCFNLCWVCCIQDLLRLLFIGLQDCPIGAQCQNGKLFGLVNGSVWVANNKTGLYTLVSCPPGYQIKGVFSRNSSIVNSLTQECSLCLASTYCLGGTAPSLDCPDGTFSPPGSMLASSCQPSTIVRALILMPMPPLELSMILSTFSDAVAAAAQVSVDTVTIFSVTSQESRRAALSSSSMALSAIADTRIASASPDIAAAVSDHLNNEQLNSALARAGLPPGSIQSVSILGQTLEPSQWFVTLAIVLSVMLAVSAVGCWYLRTLANQQTGEEKELQAASSALRRRLHIECADGFILGNEWQPPWHRRGATVFLHKSCMDAAAQLSLFRDFNIQHFDTFCFFLAQSSLPSAFTGTPHDLLCDWLLELGEELLRPRLGGDQDKTAAMTDRERSAYVAKLCKCQVTRQSIAPLGLRNRCIHTSWMQ